ncbi:hypothetical protein CXF71_18570 [Colwellia sp. 12G3]|nr:hypothetical protein CXF71_18570 [Colwellia sp. 12G3]
MSDKGDEYKNIQPNTGINVDRFDSYYDLDFILQINLRFKSSRFGCIDIRSVLGKRKIKETVLIWDTGENEKNVVVSNVAQSQYVD